MGNSKVWETLKVLIIWVGAATLLWLCKDLLKGSVLAALIGLVVALVCAMICTVFALTSSEDPDEALEDEEAEREDGDPRNGD